MIRHISRDMVKRILCVSAAVLLMAAQLLNASICHAEDMHHRSLRDGALFIAVPEDWQVEELGDLAEDADMMSDGECIFKVLEIQDSDGLKQGELWICAEPQNDSFYYCNSETDTKNYYEESGTYAADSVIEEAFPEAESWTRENIEYIKGEDDFTYVIREDTKIGTENYLMYLSCDFVTNGGVHEVLLFNKPADRSLCDEIAESLEGYSYAGSLFGNEECTTGSNGSGGSNYPTFTEDTTETGIDVGRLAVGIIWIAVWIAVIAFAVRKIRGVYKKGSIRTDRWGFKEFRKKNSDHEEHADCIASKGVRYAGYRESLETLHKSGLLTTKEMKELLEKHKDDI